MSHSEPEIREGTLVTSQKPPGVNNNPQPGDVFRASPATSVDGDAHGKRPRPVGVVERLPRVARCLGRTTHPDGNAYTETSPANPHLGLTEDAFWQDRHQRPVPRKYWGTSDFVYLGRLPDPEKEALEKFWDKTKRLGRENL